MRKLHISPYYQIITYVEKTLKIHLTCITSHCDHVYSRDRCFGTKTRFFTNGHFSQQRNNVHSRSKRFYNCSTDGQSRSVQNFDIVRHYFTRNCQSQITILIRNMLLLYICKNKPFHISQSE